MAEVDVFLLALSFHIISALIKERLDLLEKQNNRKA